MSNPATAGVSTPAAPAPQIPVYSRVDQLSAATVGALCTWLNLISLKSYSGTVTAVTPGKSITINAPNAPTPSMTFPLTPMGGAIVLPIGLLT